MKEIKRILVKIDMRYGKEDHTMKINWIDGKVKVIQNPEFEFLCLNWADAFSKATTLVNINEGRTISVNFKEVY